jgi:hypothetical protein
MEQTFMDYVAQAHSLVAQLTVEEKALLLSAEAKVFW